MRIYPLVVSLFLLCVVSTGRAQVSADQLIELKRLANQFPDVTAVQNSFRDNFDIKVAMQREMKPDAVPNLPDRGWVAAFNSAVFDNLKATLDFKYSNTLSSTLPTGTNILTPF